MAKRTRKPWVPDEAMAKGRLLEYQRAVLGAEIETGFVVGIGRKWLLIHVLDGVRLNGYQAIREGDITRARLSADKFRTRFLAISNHPGVAPDGIDLDRTRDLLRTATTRSRIVGVNTEYDDESIRYIGAARDFGNRRFAIKAVNRKAKWEPSNSRNYRYSEVSRIDFDDDYIRALLAVLDHRGTGS